jgi:hypothetical protein
MLIRNIDLFIIPSFLFRLGFRKSAVDGPILSILPKYIKKKAISKRKLNRRKKKIFGDKKTSKRILQPSQRFFRGLF